MIISTRTGENVIIAGNQKFEAAKELGMKTVPCVVLEGLTEEKEREIVIRDNVSSGEWDYTLLASDWDVPLLEEWGVDVPKFDIPEDDPEDQSQAREGGDGLICCPKCGFEWKK